ncbi:NgoMIV family type II restriction endonuclease [Streptomyces sp. RPA4-2]|uniref:NgoMIV family type II restriction endonuclease n=1 Tax=unclassified Streptomyces TaxID=2593676 RepID=UPI00143E5A13|nr:NgoMIV family type II restriction endonuclease [Streptomyces sp. RPA4-2]QIY62851.1 restriction endonuclease [Streptomyces sp. RPA4-2]
MNAPFATGLLGWKRLEKTGNLVPNSADSDSNTSKLLARHVLEALGVESDVVLPGTPDSLGPALEHAVCDHLGAVLPDLSPERVWHVDHKKTVADFTQYEHLDRVAEAVRKNATLRVDLGRDYLIKPDVTVGVTRPTAEATTRPRLHAAVSCKWTIRSDRVQNVRHEFLQMIRHRRGRLPHLVVVTAEPMPSRIASIARGTGEADAIYHIAFDALKAAVAAVGSRQQRDDLSEIIEQGRLLPYGTLPPTLSGW